MSVVVVCVLCYINEISEGLTGTVVFVFVIRHRNVSSEEAEWNCCICVCVVL